jgi:hypothetical protein
MRRCCRRARPARCSIRSASRTVDDRIVAARVQVVQRARVDAVTREPLARLWAAAGPVDPAVRLTFDLDSTICPVYGRAKQGAGFGYAQRRPTCSDEGLRRYHRGACAVATGRGDRLLSLLPDSLVTTGVAQHVAEETALVLAVRASS